MIFEYLNIIVGLISILIYKLIYFKRITFQNLPKINSKYNLSIKKGSKLLLGKNFRSRNYFSVRIYNDGIVKIGDNCFFNEGCSINCQDNIKIGDNVICGQNVMFFDHDHDYKNNINEFVRKEIVVGNNVWIGANSIILKGVKIGDNVVIAAGSIVKDDISDNMLFYTEKKSITKKIMK